MSPARHQMETPRKRSRNASRLMLRYFTLAEIRRTGLLRASRYGYQASLIAEIAKAILRNRHLLNAGPDRFTYLESVLALAQLAPNVRALHGDITKFLMSRKDEVVKTLLVIVNQCFYSGWMGNPELSPLDLRHYTAEELSEAASLLLSMYRELFKLTDESCNRVDEKALKAKVSIYDKWLVAAALTNKFREAESLIDGLPYQACLRGRAVTVSSIDPEIEKSVRLGYIQSELQLLIRTRRLSQVNAPPPIKELVEGGFGKGIEKTIEIVEHPVRRLRFRIPNAPEIFSLFSSDEPFRDEIENLLVLDVDDFENTERPFYKVTERISSQDIFKLQRYFRFLSCVYQKKLEEFTDDEERKLLTYRSTVFIVPRDHLISQVSLIFSDDEKAKEAIDLLTLDENRTFVDLQYTPFIVIGDHYVVAPHVVAASNLVRNTICANNRRPDLVVGVIDPMQQAVVEALESTGFKVCAEAKPKIGGKELETDIVAWRDDVLFLFECKNAYHPCSAHEMRNSFEHIDKARRQLDIRSDAFRQPANQKILFKKLGWELVPISEVYTGIITANRVFHGAQLNGHPVRQAHEFINVVLSGEIGGGEEKLRFWKGQEFQTADLVSYLKGETVIAEQMSALVPYSHRFEFGPRALDFLTYRMDPIVLAEKMTSSYRVSEAVDASS
jgi:hypothetical protein